MYWGSFAFVSLRETQRYISHSDCLISSRGLQPTTHVNDQTFQDECKRDCILSGCASTSRYSCSLSTWVSVVNTHNTYKETHQYLYFSVAGVKLFVSTGNPDSASASSEVLDVDDPGVECADVAAYPAPGYGIFYTTSTYMYCMCCICMHCNTYRTVRKSKDRVTLNHHNFALKCIQRTE